MPTATAAVTLPLRGRKRNAWPPLVLHDSCCSTAPSAVEAPVTSTHLPLPAFTRRKRSPPRCSMRKRCALVPLSTHCCTAAPSEVEAAATSIALPLPPLTILYRPPPRALS